MAIYSSGIINGGVLDWIADAFDDGSLMVTPESLKTQSVLVSGKIRNMQSEFENIAECVSKTSNYWIGEAGNSYRKCYEEKKPELEEIFKRLSEFVTDLEKMAGVYEQAENAALQIAEELPSDIII